MDKFTTARAFCLNHEVNPKEVGDILASLGKFTSRDIVEFARPKNSPLHKYFEWDNDKAAEAYRLTQARHLVLSIEVEEGVRAFESVVVDSKRMYVSHRDVISSGDLVAQVLQSALNELLYWRAKNERYKKHFGGVFREITVAEKAIGEKNGKIKKGKGRKEKGRHKVRHPANKKEHSRNNDSGRQPAAR